jgi:hypothetical protein
VAQNEQALEAELLEREERELKEMEVAFSAFSTLVFAKRERVDALKKLAKSRVPAGSMDKFLHAIQEFSQNGMVANAVRDPESESPSDDQSDAGDEELPAGRNWSDSKTYIVLKAMLQSGKRGHTAKEVVGLLASLPGYEYQTVANLLNKQVKRGKLLRSGDKYLLSVQGYKWVQQNLAYESNSEEPFPSQVSA